MKSTISQPSTIDAVVPIERIDVTAYRIPTESPESDGTLTWDTTTLVLVHIVAGGIQGIGYSYADRACAVLIAEKLGNVLHMKNALAIEARWQDMVRSVRNLGREGIAAMAISAVDIALWDWKARFLKMPLLMLLGAARDSIRIYGSGGFTSYSDSELQQHCLKWVDQGVSAVKMKIGREPHHDVSRVTIAREALGTDVELFVDANGAYQRKQALAFAMEFAVLDIAWFEEPVSSDDMVGLRLIRNCAPAGMNISAGEYGYTLDYFHHLLQAEAVDVLQADITRCGGVTGFLGVAEGSS